MKKSASIKRKPPGTLKPVEKSLSSTAGLIASTTHRKASTPTHDNTARADSPDISHIMPSDISMVSTDGRVAVRKRPSASVPKTAVVPSSKQEESVEEQLDFEYTHYLQQMYMRKLTEAKAKESDINLMQLQKRIAENQNVLQKTTERLKNINFNKEVEALHRLRNPNYGRVLETLDNSNTKEHLETLNKKLEQRHNQLRMKNIELPQGGGSELLQVVKDTVAACESLKATNNLEVSKVITEIKASNHSTSETLSRCLDIVPKVDDLLLEKATLEISALRNVH